MLVEKYGDIFATTARAIGHGCNCRGVMGAGIAARIRKRYPSAFAEYRQACEAGAFRPTDVQLVQTNPHWILNLATQESYGRPIWLGGGVWAKQPWIRQCLLFVVRLAEEHSIDSVAFPQLGCSLGGLFWDLADYEDKRRRFGSVVGTEPQTPDYVKAVFENVLGSVSMVAEVWAYPGPRSRAKIPAEADA